MAFILCLKVYQFKNVFHSKIENEISGFYIKINKPYPFIVKNLFFTLSSISLDEGSIALLGGCAENAILPFLLFNKMIISFFQEDIPPKSDEDHKISENGTAAAVAAPPPPPPIVKTGFHCEFCGIRFSQRAAHSAHVQYYCQKKVKKE